MYLHGNFMNILTSNTDFIGLCIFQFLKKNFSIYFAYSFRVVYENSLREELLYFSLSCGGKNVPY